MPNGEYFCQIFSQIFLPLIVLASQSCVAVDGSDNTVFNLYSLHFSFCQVAERNAWRRQERAAMEVEYRQVCLRVSSLASNPTVSSRLNICASIKLSCFLLLQMADVRAREIEAKLGGLEAEYMAAAKKQAAQHAHALASAEVCGCVPAVCASWI